MRIEQLSRATAIVARQFTGPHCVDASALMLEVGDRLGFSLSAHAVSVFAINNQTMNSVATGDFGRAFGSSYLGRSGIVVPVYEFEGGSPFQRHAGHMIVVSQELSLLIDPTFGQFSQLGDQAVPLFVQEISLHKSGRFWAAGDDGFYVRYFVADDFSEDTFVAARQKYAARADEIVAQL